MTKEVDSTLGREIREKLCQHNLTQIWLISRLEKRGIRATKTVISSALRGTRKGPAIDRILEESAAILDYYETYFK